MVMAPSVNLKKSLAAPLSAANAHRHHRQPRIAKASLQQGVTGKTGASHSIGMTHGNRPAVHFDPVWIKPNGLNALPSVLSLTLPTCSL